MRTYTIEKTVYNYNELSNEAKETAKSEILDRYHEAWIFTDMVTEQLKNLFTNSDLQTEYSLASCQGDGLNIYGDIKLIDFLPLWEHATQEEKETIKVYINNSITTYHKEHNDAGYCYSCTFIDIKYINDFIDDFAIELKYSNTQIKFNRELFNRFMLDLLKYIEQLEKEFEKDGYNFFYELSEEEAEEEAECYELEFDELGHIS